MFQHFRLKCVALLIGIAFWAGVVSLNTNVRTYAGSLQIKPFNLKENLVIANEMEPVRLRVAAPNEVFNNLSETAFNIYVDLEKLEEGEHVVPVNVTPLNPKISIARITPPTVRVVLEPQGEKMLPVAAEVRGNPAPNFAVKEVVIDLEEVNVTGPKSLLDRASRVVALAELQGNENVDILKKIPLVVVDNNENVITRVKPDIPDADAAITLIQVLKTKTVGVRANLVNDLPDRNLWVKKVSVSPPTVVVQGDFTQLQSIDYLETEPIDLAEINANFLRRFYLKLPDRIEVAEGAGTVLVKVEVDRH